MKRFSWIAFIVVMLLHIYITGELIGASIRASKALAPEQSLVWLTVWSWIWQPIPMLLRVVGVRLVHNSYYTAIALAWSVCVAVCFGFLVPHLFRRRHQAA
jgi:hypothetical protein